MKIISLTFIFVGSLFGSSSHASDESIRQITASRALKTQIIQTMEENIAWMSRKDVSLKQIQDRLRKGSELAIEQLELWNQDNPDRALDAQNFAGFADQMLSNFDHFKSKALLILKAKQELEKAKSLENYIMYFTLHVFRRMEPGLYSYGTALGFVLLPLAFVGDCVLIAPEIIASALTGF